MHRKRNVENVLVCKKPSNVGWSGIVENKEKHMGEKEKNELIWFQRG